MTAVNVALEYQNGSGRVPAAGRLTWQPTQRRVDGTVVVLPVRSSLDLPAGVGTAHLDPGVYWFVEDVNGGTSAYRIIPEAGPVDYAALPAVDPSTLTPESVPEAAWYAYTDTLAGIAQSAADAATESQDSAAASALSAGNSATSAGNSAAAALDSMGVAVDAASDAQTHATNANLDATEAALSEQAAAGHATNAGNSAAAANTSAQLAESARGGMVTGGTVNAQGELVLSRVANDPTVAGYVVGPPITLTITETTTGPDTPGTPGPQGLTGPQGPAGGIVDPTVLNAGTNLNDMMTSGLFRVVSTNATTALNHPKDNMGGHLLVIRGASTVITQVFYPLSASTFRGMYTRSMVTTWSPWVFSATSRVDQTAGRAIYTWDDLNTREQLVYGDTGWRELPPETGTASGWLRVRRQGYRVTLWIHGWQPTAAGGSTRIWTAPVGFQSGSNSIVGLVGQRDNNAVMMGVGNTGLVDINNTTSASAYYAMVSWETTQSWPTTLPGTASGSTPNL
jgi:hypothetical protein